MRLINADELWKHKVKSASERMDLNVAYMGGWNDAIDSIVENAPTVDAEPVRHGHWIEGKGGGYIGYSIYECSECGCPVGEEASNYCPYCGAKMGEVEEDE